MNIDDTRLNELFKTARALSPTFSLDDVERLVDGFPTHDGVAEPPVSGPFLNTKILLLLFALLMVAAVVAWPSGCDTKLGESSSRHQGGTASPLDTVLMEDYTGGVVTWVDTLLRDTVAISPPPPADSTVVHYHSSLNEHFAPAPSPKNPAALPPPDWPEPSAFHSDTVYATDRRGNLTDSVIAVDWASSGPVYYGEPVRGDWSWLTETRNVNLVLANRRPARYQEWWGTLKLSDAELPAARTIGEVERAAGRLRLMGEGAGRYTFEPNLNFRAHLIESNLLPENLDGVRLDYNLLKIDLHPFGDGHGNFPEDDLLLRFFTIDLDADYLNLLRGEGYGEDALREVWKLANAQLTRQHLRRYFSWARNAGVELPGESMEEILLLYRNRKNLSVLARRFAPLSYADIAAVDAMKMSAPQLNRLAKLPGDLSLRDLAELNAAGVESYVFLEYSTFFNGDLSVAQAIALNEAGLRGHDLNRLHELGFRRREPEEYVRLHRLPADKLLTLQHETKGLLVAKEFATQRRDFPKSIELDLRPFSRLIVDKGLQVVIVPGEENSVRIAHRNFNEALRVEVEQQPNGTVRLRRKVKFGYYIKAPEGIEVLIHANGLKKIHLKGDAEVYVAGQPDRYVANRTLGRARLEK